MLPCNAGDSATLAKGLSLQVTYDDSAYGELRNYHFANSTKARLGQPTGLLTTQGYALTNLYEGTVTYGQTAYWDAANGALTTTVTAPVTAADKLPVIFEGTATAGPWQSSTMGTINTNQLVRIRYNFPLV
jgi:hypothetical protein